MYTTEKAKIEALCQKHTDLSEEEITFIVQKANALEELAEVFDCDIFIDVPLKNSTASLVVFHVFPVTAKSLYKNSPVGQPALKKNEPGVWKVSRFGGDLQGYKAFTQENVFIRQNIHSITYGEKVLGTYIMERAFSESPEASEEENDYMTMTARVNNYIDDAIYFFHSSGKLLFQNEVADKFSGNISSENIYYEDLFGEHFGSHMLKLESKDFTKEIQIKDKFYLMKRVLLNDSKLKFAIILRDITQLKIKEAEIISKTEAIRETHHRIKNNLQTMASLLRMEKRRTKSTEAKQILEDNTNRVLSIAATHDILARQLGDKVELSEVLKYIINNIHRSYSLLDHIKLEIKVEESIIVLSEVATSVSLIVNELVQNSYTHAFPNRKSGRIQVSLSTDGEDVVVTVADNGKGFAVEKVKGNSLGLFIIKSYVKDKLKGKIQFNRRKSGMEITFRFK